MWIYRHHIQTVSNSAGMYSMHQSRKSGHIHHTNMSMFEGMLNILTFIPLLYIAAKDITRASCWKLGKHYFQHSTDPCIGCVCGYFYHWESDNSCNNKWEGQILLYTLGIQMCFTHIWMPLSLVTLPPRLLPSAKLNGSIKWPDYFRWQWLYIAVLQKFLFTTTKPDTIIWQWVNIKRGMM